MDSLAAMQFGLAPALATALLQALWQDALLGVAAWLALSAMARSSAALRHAVAMAFLVAMVVVPASTFVHFWKVPATDVNTGLVMAMTTPRANGPALFEQQSDPVAIALALLWLAGVAVMLLRHFGGWRMVAALEKQPFERLPADWQRRVDALCAAMRIGRDVSVRVSTTVVGPFTARLLRPVIWLPVSLVTALPREQAEALIAHELAHIARMDWLWNGLQCLLEALLFFHPAAWWLGRRIRIEREHACDDRAVAACGDAIALAEALAELERQRLPSPRLLLAAHGGALMQRISRLLSGSNSRARWHLPAGLVLLLASGTLLAAQLDLYGQRRPNLRIQSSTKGALGPGDFLDIKAQGLDSQRHYRASLDGQGRLTETYEVDGQARVIDSEVRAWLAEIDRLSTPPAPPAPPAPPEVPEPPPVPRLEDSKEFQELLALVRQDPGVAAKIGSPATVVDPSIGGHLRTGGSNDQGGDADLSFVLSGPRGRARVNLSAERSGGTWTVSELEVEPQ